MTLGTRRRVVMLVLLLAGCLILLALGGCNTVRGAAHFIHGVATDTAQAADGILRSVTP